MYFQEFFLRWNLFKSTIITVKNMPKKVVIFILGFCLWDCMFVWEILLWDPCWPQTSSCFSLPTTGVTGVCHGTRQTILIYSLGLALKCVYLRDSFRVVIGKLPLMLYLGIHTLFSPINSQCSTFNLKHTLLMVLFMVLIEATMVLMYCCEKFLFFLLFFFLLEFLYIALVVLELTV